MRVLYLTRDFPPNASAGTEVHTLGLAAGLQELGHEVSVICIGRWNEGPHYFNGFTHDVYQGIAVTRVNLNWLRAPDPTGYLYRNPIIADLIRQFIGEQKPDVVHVTSCDRISASVIPSAKQAGVPVVLTLTDFWFICPRINLVRSNGTLCDGQTTAWDCLKCMTAGTKIYRGLAKFLPAAALQAAVTGISRRPRLTRHRGLRGMAGDMADRKRYLSDVLRQADYVAIATPFGRKIYNSIVQNKEIHLMPYGHDLSWLSAYSGKTPSAVVRIGYVGRLDETKGAHLLIQAFKRLPTHLPAVLSIFGRLPHDPYGESLRMLAAGDQRIHFYGTYAHEDSARVYTALDVLVIPSLWYDFPLVAHEALASQTALVATDLPGLNEIVDDETTGLLFPRGDVSALTEKLHRLLVEPDLLKRLRENKVSVRSVQDAAREYSRLYDRLVSHDSKT